MKISILSNRTAVGLIATALTLSGCSKPDPEEPDKGGGATPPPKKEEVVPPKKEEADPPPTPPKKETTPPPKKETTGGGKVESEMEGYWALDAESIKAMIKAEMSGGEGGQPNPFIAMMDPIVEMMADKVVLELSAGKSKMYSPAMPAGGLEVKEGAYKITASDDSKGTFTIEITDKDGTEASDGTIKGDTMSMTKKGESTMKANRLAKADFDKRLKEIEAFKLDMSKLIPGGLEGLKDLIPEGFEIPEGLIPEGVKIPDGILPDGVKIPDANKAKPVPVPGGTE